jgi:alpha-L-rhamnosidase
MTAMPIRTKTCSLAIFLLLFACLINAQVRLTRLSCENRIDPRGVDAPHPRLSWQLQSEQRNMLQTAYEIRVAESVFALSKNRELVWNSGKIVSGASVNVPYGGSALQPGQYYYWQVRIWDNKGKSSPWSQTARWQTGLLEPANWKAQWISTGDAGDTVFGASPCLRKPFTSSKKIESATLYITSHGLYEAWLNGKRVGDACLSPGWTSYNKRLLYQTYDVTPLVNQGNNVIGAVLGSGWYRTPLAWGNNRNHYGKTTALLAQLQLRYKDNTEAWVVSDNSWKWHYGPIQQSEIYDGEWYDARRGLPGWASASFDDTPWKTVTLTDDPKTIISASENEPIRKHEAFKPLRIFTTPRGEHVADFGQNLVGWVQVRAKGEAGDSIIIHHAEVLDREGNFYTDNLRAAKQRDIYILKGGEAETFEPHFTFQGFRYIKITGSKTNLGAEDITATALYSDLPVTGNFICSDSLLNQLQHNIQWGQRGNFLDVPTDCPQRDERLGWTGDAEAFSRTAAFNRQVDNFFAKWLKDLAADQYPNGSVPHVIPNVLGPNAGGSAGWADAATIIPWNMYLAYGDKKILEDQYGSMKAWVDFMQANSSADLWNRGFHFGDWLFYHPDDDNDGRAAITDKYLAAQCFFAHSTQLLVNAARTLGKTDDLSRYEALLQKIKAAFVREYATPSGRLVSGSQTAYVLALQFDMLPENLRAQAAGRLAENIRSYNNHLTTGFLGTPYLCHVLTRYGYTDLAYTLLLQKTYPSWLYPVSQGATTIWERWDGRKPDGSFENPGMNSFNHYAYGAIGDWMYRAMAGLDTDESGPGYKHLKIMPHPGGNIRFARADLETPYGLAASYWKEVNGGLQLDIVIPPNTSATVYIPATDAGEITENNLPLLQIAGIKRSGAEKNYVIVEAGSGSYHFVVSKK